MNVPQDMQYINIVVIHNTNIIQQSMLHDNNIKIIVARKLMQYANSRA